MGLRSIKVKVMTMKETVVDIIKRLDRDLVCTINTLAKDCPDGFTLGRTGGWKWKEKHNGHD